MYIHTYIHIYIYIYILFCLLIHTCIYRGAAGHELRRGLRQRDLGPPANDDDHDNYHYII